MGLDQIASRMWIFYCLLLFLYHSTKSQSISTPPSPCFSTFQYGQDSNGEMIGHIGIFSLDNRKVILTVELSIGNYVPNNYVGEIHLASNDQTTINDIQQGKPIRYILRFPRWEGSPPRITKIHVNGQKVCEGNPISNARVVSTVTLTHTLKAPGTDFSSGFIQNSNAIPNVFNNNPYFFIGVNPFVGKSNSPLVENFGSPIFGGNGVDTIIQPQNLDDSVFNRFTISTTSASTQRKTNPSSLFTKNPFLAGTSQDSRVGFVPTLENMWPTSSPPASPTIRNTLSLPTKTGIKPIASGECGRASTRVVQLVVFGESVKRGEYPWLVAMFVESSGSQLPTYRCCGNLVTTKHVITAAHCVYDGRKLIPAEKLSIVLGKLNIRSLITPKYSNVVGVSRSTPHPEYVSSGDTNRKLTSDLAVVVLDPEVEFNDFIKPICLWSEDNDLDLVVNEAGTVVGWGRDENGADSTEEPKQISIPIVGQSTCLRSNAAYRNLTSSTTFCAGAKDKKGPCTGDSGSGFIMNRNGKWTLRGIVSSSIYDSIRQTCDLSHYVIFTDVSKYLPWIEEQISST